MVESTLTKTGIGLYIYAGNLPAYVSSTCTSLDAGVNLVNILFDHLRLPSGTTPLFPVVTPVSMLQDCEIAFCAKFLGPMSCV